MRHHTLPQPDIQVCWTFHAGMLIREDGKTHSVSLTDFERAYGRDLLDRVMSDAHHWVAIGVPDATVPRITTRDHARQTTTASRIEKAYAAREAAMTTAAEPWLTSVLRKRPVSSGERQRVWEIDIAHVEKPSDDVLIHLCGGCAFDGFVSKHVEHIPEGRRYSVVVYED